MTLRDVQQPAKIFYKLHPEPFQGKPFPSRRTDLVHKTSFDLCILYVP